MLRRQKRTIDGKVWEHSGGIPRTKADARALAEELRSSGLLARLYPSTTKKGKWDVYVRRKK